MIKVIKKILILFIVIIAFVCFSNNSYAKRKIENKIKANVILSDTTVQVTNYELTLEEEESIQSNSKNNSNSKNDLNSKPVSQTSKNKLTKRQQRRIDKLMKKYNIDTVTYSKEYYDSLKVANPFSYVVDYMAKDKDNFDKINLDSLSRTLFTDTLVVKGGTVPEFNSTKAIDNVKKLDSLISAKTLIDKKMQRIMGSNKDTLSLTATTFISLVVPGFAQIKNRDYWKLPILYGGTGGFLSLGFMANKKTNIAKLNYEKAIYNKIPQTEINSLHKHYNSLKNEQMAYFAGAVVTYAYFLADGIYNFDGNAKGPAKAALLGLFLPGGGQIYNKSYWKLPIYYGALAAVGYVVSFNNNGYQRYNTAFKLLADDDPNTIDEFEGRYTKEQVKSTRDQFRRARDLSILYTCGVYLLGVVEAYVDASFKTYDISDDLAFKITPTFSPIGNPVSSYSNNMLYNSMIGVSVDFVIK